MTQRVFDMENEKDIKDLFDILPDWVEKIDPIEDKDIEKGITLHGADKRFLFAWELNINWHERTYIDRPVDESKWIGCLCWFWDKDESIRIAGLLETIRSGSACSYIAKNGVSWGHCRPVKKEEITFAD